MTERMQAYRFRKEMEGMIQVRVWVPKDHEELIKHIAKQCRPDKPLKIKERYGRRATPQHLYDHHISLSAWIWANGGRPMTD